MAVGDTLYVWGMRSNSPPATLAATPDVRYDVASTPDVPHDVLDFSDTTNWYASFSGIMPSGYDGSGGVVMVHKIAMSSAEAGEIDIDGAFARILAGTDDLDGNNFAAAQSTDGTTVPGTTGITADVSITFTHAQMGSIVAGDGFVYLFNRDPVGEAGDGAAGDMELWKILMKQA